MKIINGGKFKEQETDQFMNAKSMSLNDLIIHANLIYCLFSL